MADSTDAPDVGTEVGAEDVVAVRSRVSWGAVLAGAVVALAAYLVLTLLGGAIGLSVSGDVRSETLNTGAAVWAVATTGLALFLGGWVTSQAAVGENKTEAAIHGVIMWGVVLFMILWLVGTGLRAGFNAMWGVAGFTNSAVQNAGGGDWEAAAQRAGVSQATLEEWKRQAQQAPAEARQAVADPANRDAAARTATKATWYTLLGTVLSMAAAVFGALVGAGPSFRLLGVRAAGRRTRV